MKKDTYAHIPSKKSRVATLEDSLGIIRRSYPEAYFEGSAGLQRTVWIRAPEDRRVRYLVGHTWSTRNEFWHVRVFNEPEKDW